MKVSEKVEKLSLQVYSGNQEFNREIKGNYTSYLPIDDIGNTISGNPSIDFISNHKINSTLYSFNTLETKEVLGEISIIYLSVSRHLKEMFQVNLEELQIVALGYRT